MNINITRQNTIKFCKYVYHKNKQITIVKAALRQTSIFTINNHIYDDADYFQCEIDLFTHHSHSSFPYDSRSSSTQ